MAFSKQAFSQEEREKLKNKIKELEDKIKELKGEKENINQIEDMLC